MTVERRERIRALNDQLRRFLIGGKVMLTRGVLALSHERVVAIMKAIAEFDRFDDRNDPHGEHDFGCVDVAGQLVFFKIDYYSDGSLSAGSEDPADPDRFTRVMVAMLAEEY